MKQLNEFVVALFDVVSVSLQTEYDMSTYWDELNWNQNTYLLNRDLIRKKHSFKARVSFQLSKLFRAGAK